MEKIANISQKNSPQNAGFFVGNFGKKIDSDTDFWYSILSRWLRRSFVSSLMARCLGVSPGYVSDLEELRQWVWVESVSVHR